MVIGKNPGELCDRILDFWPLVGFIFKFQWLQNYVGILQRPSSMHHASYWSQLELSDGIQSFGFYWFWWAWSSSKFVVSKFFSLLYELGFIC